MLKLQDCDLGSHQVSHGMTDLISQFLQHRANASTRTVNHPAPGSSWMHPKVGATSPLLLHPTDPVPASPEDAFQPPSCLQR